VIPVLSVLMPVHTHYPSFIPIFLFDLNPRLAYLISAVFHPLFMPTILYAVIFYFSPAVVSPISGNLRLYLLAGIAIATLFIPMLFIYILQQYEIGRDLHLVNGPERDQGNPGSLEPVSVDGEQALPGYNGILPFIVTTVVYGTFTYFFSLKLNELAVIYLILGSMTVVVALITIINLFWKISAHSVGISAVVGSLIGIQEKFAGSELFYPILVSILAAGLLMSARLSLNSHSPAQVLAGCLLGLLVSLGAVHLYI